MPASRLYDNHNRPINYLRLAVTDRCNLRCFYCMPEQGIQYVPRRELLSYEEMLRIVQLLSALGIEKLRITGGEPFLRKDMLAFLKAISQIKSLRQINITTNGTLTAPIIPQLKAMGVASINLSLDSLDAQRFFQITRRNELPKVLHTLDQLLKYDMPVKINMVVMEGQNEADIVPMALLTKDQPINVRYIEEMPFNGSGPYAQQLHWNHRRILEHLKHHFPDVQKIADPPSSTAMYYQIPGYQGQIGIIAAYSRTFCGSCNRIRITPKGMLKTCLYDDGVFNIKELIRAGATDQQLQTAFLEALRHRARDGFEAEQQRRFGNPATESMSTIGG